ncbi:MAG: hypothetical protein I4N51_19355, partial [Acinetobacter sp.]|nr:hypothetical protein [Acinetobacter sp.]
MLKAKFSGQAREAIINSKELNEENNYATFKTKIIQEFKAKHNFENTQNEFAMLKQLPTQNMADFIKIFDNVAAKYIEESGHAQEPGAINLLQKIKLTRFLEAIRQDIALEIRKQGAETYDRATQMAIKIERAYNYQTREELNYVDTHPQSHFQETFENLSKNYLDKIAELKAEIEGLKLQNSNKDVKKPLKCEICYKNNHNTQNCFFNGKNKNRERKFHPEYRENKFRGNFTEGQIQPYMTNAQLYSHNGDRNYPFHVYPYNPVQNYQGMDQAAQNNMNYVAHNMPNTSRQEMGFNPQNLGSKGACQNNHTGECYNQNTEKK